MLLCQRVMFIRSRTSKGKAYLQLVRGYRDADGVVRQETIGLGQSDPHKTLSLDEAIKDEIAHEREWLRKSRRERGQWAKHDTAFAHKQHAKWERSVSRAEDKIRRLEAALVDTPASPHLPARARPAAEAAMRPTLIQQALTQRDGYKEETLYGVTAIAQALGTTAKQVQALRAHHGLPTFWTGRMLCARADELDLWIKQQRDDA
jgi:hypothetical protein